MKENLTELVFVLDRSGSMGPLTDDTIGGFNSMIEDQKGRTGETYVTTVLFNQYHDVLLNHIDIKEIPPMTKSDYLPFGQTALLDAVGLTIDNIGERLANTPEEERPDNVVFVIVTDGQENCSRKYSKSKVKEMIEHQQDKYSWTFMFLGANIDAVSEAADLGINTDFAKTYTASNVGVQSVYCSLSKAVTATRGVGYDSKNSDSLGYKVVVNALNEVQ